MIYITVKCKFKKVEVNVSVGPTNLCLFVWLMSEVLPRQIEHKMNDYASGVDFNSKLINQYFIPFLHNSLIII